MSTPTLAASIVGIGFWTGGLPDWDAARHFVLHGEKPANAPARPAPQLLAPNERRRAPDTVAVALEVALAACNAARRDPATLSSVFASTHGDLAITDYMCSTLVHEPRTISPTKFHNSVHNAAAGYWTIGTGAMAAATAISAFDASFAQGLLEALAQLATGTEAVLLVGYDSASTGPLAHTSRSKGLLAGALLLVREPQAGAPRLHAGLRDAGPDAAPAAGPLARLAAGNAMTPMLPLFELLALGSGRAPMHAGQGRVLDLVVAPGAEP